MSADRLKPGWQLDFAQSRAHLPGCLRLVAASGVALKLDVAHSPCAILTRQAPHAAGIPCPIELDTALANWRSLLNVVALHDACFVFSARRWPAVFLCRAPDCEDAVLTRWLRHQRQQATGRRMPDASLAQLLAQQALLGKAMDDIEQSMARMNDQVRYALADAQRQSHHDHDGSVPASSVFFAYDLEWYPER